MLRAIKSLFGSTSGRAPDIDPDMRIAPEFPMAAVGDLHGCIDQMERLLARIAAENPDAHIVFLGDYVDRGPASAQVLERVRTLTGNQPSKHTALIGNHEVMMLEFLDDPAGKGLRWLVNGGVQTLESFGISGIRERPDPDDALDICEDFEAALPEGLVPWMRDLPKMWTSGNIACVHAAIKPGVPLDRQEDRALLWGHPEFMRAPVPGDTVIVHGHTIVPGPVARDGRISIDTGAYRTGRLTAACIEPGRCHFLMA